MERNRIRRALRGVVGGAALAIALAAGASLQVDSGHWQPGAALVEARSGATAVRLADGRILLSGGVGADGSPLASAELIGADGTSRRAPAPVEARHGHSATLLADGRVLVAGGTGADGQALASAEIYDPVFDYWAPIGPMRAARSGHQARALDDGRIVVSGGISAGSPALEVFDPADESFSTSVLTAVARPRSDAASVVLDDGRVLVLGGSDGLVPLASTELYDPTTGLVSEGPTMTTPRARFAATRLLDGRVLVSGGVGPSGELDSAELYDPESGAFEALDARLAAPRSGHLAMLLPDNHQVLIVSGEAAGLPAAGAELYLPNSRRFVATGAPASARRAASGSPLAEEGRLLLAGGDEGAGAVASTDVYGFQTVRTDKRDYAPGEVVTISGRGWQPGELVALLLARTPKTAEDTSLLAAVGADGRFATSDYLTTSSDLGVLFDLTANGETSGLAAANRFTDGTLSVVGSFVTAGDAAGLSATRYSAAGCAGAADATGTRAYSLTATGTSPTLSPSAIHADSAYRLVAAATSNNGGAFSGWACERGTVTAFAGGAGARDACVTGQGNDNGNVVTACTATYGAAAAVNTVTTITSDNPDPSALTQNVTVAYSVARSGSPSTGAAPTGSVTVTVSGGAETCTGALVGGPGTAIGSCTLALTAAGSRTITATYAGATGFNGSSGTATHTVNAAPTTTTATVTPEPSVVGLPYTVNVTVASAGAGTPGGTVQVSADNGQSCTATLAAGSGSCSITPTTAGTRQLTATYAATANYATSSTTVSHVVARGTTATTITADTPDPSVVGQSYTVSWTVAVTAGAGTPTGTVTVDDGLGATCSGSLPSGSCQLTGTGAGGRTLTATYAGDANFTGSSGIADHTVARGQTSTALVATPSPSRYGESVTFTATVCPAGAASGVPTGTVDFVVDGGAAVPAMLVAGLGACPTASYTTAALATGPRSVTASYAEDTQFLGSSATLLHTVQKAVTAVAITATSPAPSVAGEAVTVSVELSLVGPGSGTPTGSVTISAGPGETCTATLPATSCAISFASAGSRSLVATYSGDGNFLSSVSASYGHTVNARTTTTTVSFAPGSVVVGQSAVATLTVRDAESRGTPSAPAGTVGLSTSQASSIAGSPCTLAAVDASSASCTVNVTPDKVDGGSHAFAAAYTAAGAVHSASNGSGTLTVTARATAVVVTVAPTSVKVGKPATVTVEVRDDAGTGTVSTPAGTLALGSSDAGDTVGSCTLAATATPGLARCTATVTPQAVAGGSRTLSAAYTADDDIHAGSSGSAGLVVQPRATVTTVMLSKGQVVVGEDTLATVIVADDDGAGGSLPRGSIVLDTGDASDSLSGPCVLPASGPATCQVTITPTRFGSGSRQVRATYTANDDIHAGSTAAPAALAVAKRATTTTVTLAPIQVVTGQPTQATVTVTDSAGIGLASTPAGSVVLLSNGLGDIVGSCTLNASASCTASVTPTQVGAGSRMISASYTANDDVHLGSSGAAGLSVVRADTATTLASSPNPSIFGSPVNFTATVCVAAPGSGLPGGLVEFSIDGSVYTATLSGAGCPTATVSVTHLLAGDRPASARYLGNADFNASGPATLTQRVQPLATTTTVTVSTPKQYSDLGTFTATVSPASLLGQTAATGVDFYVGSQKMGSAALVNGTATLSAALLEVPGWPANGQLAPGSRTVTAVFTGLNPNFTVGNATTTLTVEKEDARATYTGAMFVGTSSATATTGIATLAATVQDISVTADANGDTSAGDIRNATLRFVDRGNGATLCSAPIGLVSASDTRTGVATCNATLSVGSCPSAPCSQQYTVGVVVDGYYVNGAEGDSVVTIAQPGNGFITGGGYLSLTGSAGDYAGGAGSRNNFGFNVKYNKQKTNLQGNINTIIRRNGRVYQVKGNSMTSLAVQTTTAGGTATFNGKASISDITVPTAPLSIDGNASLQVTMTDNGEPGANDSIGITVFNKSGGLFFASKWSGTKTVEQTLAGGNLVVR